MEIDLPQSAASKRLVAVVDGLRSTFVTSGAPTGLVFHLTGGVAAPVDSQNQSTHTAVLTELLSVLFIISLLFLTFRALLAPFVALLPSVVAMVVAGPLIALSTRVGVQVSDLTPILLTVVLLGAGTDYGLFLIFRLREEIRRGRSVHDAVAVSVCKVGESITFSGLTVMGALATVAIATFGLYRGLGPALAIGIAIALIANLTLLPALLTVLGTSVFWPRIPASGQRGRGTWGAIAGKVVGRPVLTLILGLVFLGGLAASMVAYTPSGFGSQGPPASSDSGRGQAILMKDFPTAGADSAVVLFRLPISVWNEPQVLAGAARTAAHSRARLGHRRPKSRRRFGRGRHLGRGPPATCTVRPGGSIGRPATTRISGAACHLERLPRLDPVHQRRRSDHPLRRVTDRRTSKQHGRRTVHPSDPDFDLPDRPADRGDLERYPR